MNVKIIALTLKGLFRRWKMVLRVMAVMILTFFFVTGMLLFQENMNRWQTASAKKHFGDWFVIYRANKPEEKDVIKYHPYLERACMAETVGSVSDLSGASDIMIGTMSDDFITMGNIRLEQGHMPQKDDEVVIDRNSLLMLGQGSEPGMTITINDKSYILTGILTSYTNVWRDGSSLPGIIVTDNEADRIVTERRYIYAYPLKSYIDEKDYSSIVSAIQQSAELKYNFIYNSSVYDYKPWGNELVNNYLYVLFMLIGISAVTYQLISYNKTRKNVRFVQRNLGASGMQMFLIYVLENIVILMISTVIGICAALGIGRIISLVIESDLGITFFKVGSYTLKRTAITLIGAVIISSVVELVFGCVKKKNRVNRILTVKNIFNKKNYVVCTGRRFMKSHGAVQNIMIRVFSLVMAVITLICVINTVMAFSEYKRCSDSPDIVAYKTDNVPTQNVLFCQSLPLYEEIELEDGRILTKMTISSVDMEPGTWNAEAYDSFHIRKYYFNDVRYGDSYIFNGISEDIIDSINKLPGVEDMSYGYYDTQRSFTWHGINMDNIGRGAELGNGSAGTQRNGNYIYAAEYVDPDMDIYDILNEYAEGELDYQAFSDGSQAVMFLDSNYKGIYDDSMKDGIILNLQNYDDSYYYMKNDFENKNEYAFAYEKLIHETVGEYSSDPYDFFWRKYIARNIPRELILEMTEGINIRIPSFLSYLSEDYDSYIRGDITTEQFLTDDFWGNKVSNEWNYRYDIKSKLIPAASTNVVKVIKVTDEVKDKLKYYVPQFGQYTLVASTKLAEKAVDSQNELNREYLFLDELPDYARLKMKPNQINIRYNLNSAFSATDNIVTSYLQEAGFSYISYSEEKNQLRQKTIEGVMFFGLTGIASVIIYLIVSAIVVKNRMAGYKDRLQLLSNSGADADKLIKICMYECIRESLWFVVLMPLELIISYCVIYRTLK